MRFYWSNSIKNIWRLTGARVVLVASLAIFFGYHFFWKQFSLEQPVSESTQSSGIVILIEDLLEFLIDTAANIWSGIRPLVDPDNWNLDEMADDFPQSLWENPAIFLGIGITILILFLAVQRSRKSRVERKILQEELQAALDEEDQEEEDRPLFPLATERTLSTNEMDWDEPDSSLSTELNFNDFEKSFESLPQPDNDDESHDHLDPREKIISIADALPSPESDITEPEAEVPHSQLAKQPNPEEIFLIELEEEITSAALNHSQEDEDQELLEAISSSEEEEFHQNNLRQETEVTSSIQESTDIEKQAIENKSVPDSEILVQDDLETAGSAISHLPTLEENSSHNMEELLLLNTDEMSPEDKLLRKLESDFREWENLAQKDKSSPDLTVEAKEINEKTTPHNEKLDHEILETTQSTTKDLSSTELIEELKKSDTSVDPSVEVSQESFLNSSSLESLSTSDSVPEDPIEEYEQSISKLQLEMDKTFEEISEEIDLDKSDSEDMKIEAVSPKLHILGNLNTKTALEKINLESAPKPEPIAKAEKNGSNKKSDMLINRLETFHNKLEKRIHDPQSEKDLTTETVYLSTKTCVEGTNGRHSKSDDNFKILESFIWTEKQKMIGGAFSKTH